MKSSNSSERVQDRSFITYIYSMLVIKLEEKLEKWRRTVQDDELLKHHFAVKGKPLEENHTKKNCVWQILLNRMSLH